MHIAEYTECNLFQSIGEGFKGVMMFKV
jgi:hypothetical protein